MTYSLVVDVLYPQSSLVCNLFPVRYWPVSSHSISPGTVCWCILPIDLIYLISNSRDLHCQFIYLTYSSLLQHCTHGSILYRFPVCYWPVWPLLDLTFHYICIFDMQFATYCSMHSDHIYHLHFTFYYIHAYMSPMWLFLYIFILFYF